MNRRIDDVTEVLNRRFDEQEKLIQQMFNVHAVRLNTVENILANRDSDHDKIEQRVIQQLEPKIDHIMKALDDHIIDEKGRLDNLEVKVDILEHVEETKAAETKKKIKSTLIGWGIPVIVLLVLDWARTGFHIPGVK